MENEAEAERQRLAEEEAEEERLRLEAEAEAERERLAEEKVEEERLRLEAAREKLPKPPSSDGIIPPELTMKFYKPLSKWYADQIEARGLQKGETINQYNSCYLFRYN